VVRLIRAADGWHAIAGTGAHDWRRTSPTEEVLMDPAGQFDTDGARQDFWACPWCGWSLRLSSAARDRMCDLVAAAVGAEDVKQSDGAGRFWWGSSPTDPKHSVAVDAAVAHYLVAESKPGIGVSDLIAAYSLT
jgi:hypothetical protein